MEPRFHGVAFDLDHTLLVDNRLEHIALLDMLVHIEGERFPLHLSLDLAGEIAEEELARFRHGQQDVDELLERFVERCGARDGRSWAAWFEARCLASVATFVLPMPGASRTFERLTSAGIALAALSNGPSPLQERKAAQIGFHAPVLASGAIGARKPDPRAFAQLAAQLALPPERIAYVGDDPHGDIGGALAAGMAAIWFDGSGTPYPADAPPPTARITALDELFELCVRA